MTTLFVRQGGKVFGPLAVEKVAEALTKGKIGPQDEVSKDGQQWHPVEKVSAQILAAAVKPAAPNASGAGPVASPAAPGEAQSGSPRRAVPPLPRAASRADASSLPIAGRRGPASSDSAFVSPSRSGLRYTGELGVVLCVLSAVLSALWFGVAFHGLYLGLKTGITGANVDRWGNDPAPSIFFKNVAAAEQVNHGLTLFAVFATFGVLILLVIWHVRRAELMRMLGLGELGFANGRIILSYLVPPLNLVVPAVGLKQLWRGASDRRGDASAVAREATPVTIWAALRLAGLIAAAISTFSIWQLSSETVATHSQGRVLKKTAEFELARAGSLLLYAGSVGLLALIVLRIERSVGRRVAEATSRSAAGFSHGPSYAPTLYKIVRSLYVFTGLAYVTIALGAFRFMAVAGDCWAVRTDQWGLSPQLVVSAISVAWLSELIGFVLSLSWLYAAYAVLRRRDPEVLEEPFSKGVATFFVPFVGPVSWARLQARIRHAAAGDPVTVGASVSKSRTVAWGPAIASGLCLRFAVWAGYTSLIGAVIWVVGAHTRYDRNRDWYAHRQLRGIPLAAHYNDPQRALAAGWTVAGVVIAIASASAALMFVQYRFARGVHRKMTALDEQNVETTADVSRPPTRYADEGAA